MTGMSTAVWQQRRASSREPSSRDEAIELARYTIRRYGASAYLTSVRLAKALLELTGSPELGLCIDGARDVVLYDGKTIACLRGRTILKRLLFLFASSPGQVFSKEALIQTVWRYEYHPLRHDGTLFTNMARLRRLLGDGRRQILRGNSDGYQFCPPPGFVFVPPIEAQLTEVLA